MFEEAARLIRQMDAALANADLDLRARVRLAFELSHRVSDALRPFWVEHNWKVSPWPCVKAALGPEPLRNEDKVYDILDTLADGAIRDWCVQWWRAGKQVEPDAAPAG